MLLIREFRMEWPNRSLLTADDTENIRWLLDCALYSSTNDRLHHLASQLGVLGVLLRRLKRLSVPPRACPHEQRSVPSQGQVPQNSALRHSETPGVCVA